MSERDELQAAAERWTKDSYHVDDDPQMDDDAYTLARAYMELRDPTPITEEWLIEQRLVRHDDLEINLWGSMVDHHECMCIVASWVRDPLQQVTGQHLETRGQLRCLLLAMGVEVDS
jgi:hypothetical protein